MGRRSYPRMVLVRLERTEQRVDQSGLHVRPVSPDLPRSRERTPPIDPARDTLRWLGPCLGGRRPLSGGPAIATFQPFWSAWLWRFVHEIDNSLIGFVLWHRFGDWRAPGEWGAPRDVAIYRDLLMM